MNKGDRVHLIRPGQTGPGLIWRIVDIHTPYALIDLAHGGLLGPQRELLSDLKLIVPQPDPTTGDTADFAAEVARLTALKEGSVAGSEQYAQADAWLDEIQANGLESATQRPDPTKTGPCELKLSFACTGTGYERLDPRDMLTPETSFRIPVIICVECNDMAADHYLKELHS